MDLLILANAANDVSAMETVPAVGSPDEVYEIAGGDSLDFDSWTSLISEIEKTYSDNIKAISSVYESFLSWFPLCHENWKRYADHMARLCTVEKAVEIFEQAVQSATYSVGLWVDYCSFSILTFADPSDVRRIFERGLSFVGKDFLCHRLWDLYIKFELSQQQWSSLAHIIIRAQKFPTKSLHKYYDSLKEFAAFIEEDMSCAKSCNLEPFAVDSNIQAVTSDDEILLAIKELQDSTSVDLRSKALNKFIAIGERYYNESCKLHEKIDCFENYMDMDLFNVKSLDDEELQNWHNYLDFIEKQEDFDWAVKLYERCLIPCANYPEFWMRYVEFMESKGGRELANFALERATQVFLKNVSEVHIFNARFREKIGDIEGARAAFHLCDTDSDSAFIETAIQEANMETRLGHMDTALEIYDKALKVAAEKEKMHIFPTLYMHFFRLKFRITGNADAAMDILIAGIKQVPYSRLLLEELINFAMMHEGSKQVDIVDSFIASAITYESEETEGLTSKDREDLSKLYMKFVDYCGTAHEIRKAWNRHIKYFPHLIRMNPSLNSPSNHISNDLKEPRKKIPSLVPKKPSRVQSIKHISPAKEKHKLSASKSRAIEPHKPSTNQYEENDDNNSAKENTRIQQSGENSSGEVEGSKHQFENLSQNEIHVSPKHDEIRTQTEEEHEHEHEVETSLKLVSSEKEPKDIDDTMHPPTTNQNSFPASESNKQTETDEHVTNPPQIYSQDMETSNKQIEDEHVTNLPQISSQDMETCKTTHILAASEHVNPESNFQQPQNNSSTSHLHLLPQNVQSTFQYPVQSSEQYNQIWQYQNQQQQQNQQQWLQMQQSYLQQQSYIQQQQQLQPQHYQFYQQQLEQYQQYWFQMYQQQQLQEYNMQMQQYQQNPQHHIAVMSNQMWNGSCEPQGQGTVPPPSTSAQADYMRHIQQNLAAQPISASALTNTVSPSNRLQSSRYIHSPSVE